MALDVLTGFDGSSPHFKSGVRRDSRGRFTLLPGTRRNGAPARELQTGCARFSTRLRNSGARTVKTVLTVDWSRNLSTAHYDIGYIRPQGEDEWTMVPGVRSGGVVRHRLDVPPGTMELGLYPAYNYAACRQYVRRLRSLGLDVQLIGRSRQKRGIWQIRLPSRSRKAKEFFIQARDHAYETAGSYCAEGVIDFLLSDSTLSGYLRSKFHVTLVPMTNPDGVYNGLTRLTRERGADMNRIHTAADAAHAALKRAIDRARPFVHMNIHNWQDKFQDGLLANEENIMRRILEHLPADHAHHKRWFLQTYVDYLNAVKKRSCPKENQSWKDYVRDKYDGIGVTFEFPWFMRNTADMREVGRKAFVAYALAVIEEEHL